MNITYQEIKEVRESFPSLVKETPLEYNERLSNLYGCEVYFKREDLQEVRSYKIRGAFNAIRNLSDEQKFKGVVCASAGNHAQGFALACSYFKIKGIVVMPITTPKQKINRTKKFGGKFLDVILFGDTFDESALRAQEFVKEKEMTYIPPFNNLNIILGQSTVAYEIFKQLPFEPDYIIVPIGGGGICSGIVSYLNSINSKTKIIGVEPMGASSMKGSLKLGEVKELDDITTFVDGASVAKVGELCFSLIKTKLNYEDIISVPENRLCSTLLDLLQEEGIILEPAGVLSIDALKDVKCKLKGKKVVCILSGGNFDFDRISDIKERSMLYEGVKRYFIVNFPQRPGALREFLGLLRDGDDIVRFEYLKKSSNREYGPALVVIENKNNGDFDNLINIFKDEGVDFEEITYNSKILNYIV